MDPTTPRAAIAHTALGSGLAQSLRSMGTRSSVASVRHNSARVRERVRRTSGGPPTFDVIKSLCPYTHASMASSAVRQQMSTPHSYTVMGT
jgi:hypothetical protein